eukprot:364324-Chlamydomonas_euryale.AAC.2
MSKRCALQMGWARLSLLYGCVSLAGVDCRTVGQATPARNGTCQACHQGDSTVSVKYSCTQN